jgi:hypothetical protein
LLHAYPAIIHCHSSYSDGGKSIPEIARIADESGLRFLMMTDHNHLRPLKDGHNKWYGNVCLDIGYEINDENDQNHYLAFGLTEEVNRFQRPAHYVRDVAANGGFGFIAHPHEKRHQLPKYKIYPWTDWDATDFTGIEIWNHMSSWMESLTPMNLLTRFIHPRKTVWGPFRKTLNKWDEVAIGRVVTGIGGADAHGHLHTIFGNIKVEIFDYKILFKCLRTYILSDKKINAEMPYEDAVSELHRALQNGRVFFGQYYLGDFSTFRFFARKDDKTYQMGDLIDGFEGVSIKALIPGKNAKWHLLCNGELIRAGEGKFPDFLPHKPGVYRLEVFRGQRPWFFSNHLYIRNYE